MLHKKCLGRAPVRDFQNGYIPTVVKCRGGDRFGKSALLQITQIKSLIVPATLVAEIHPT